MRSRVACLSAILLLATTLYAQYDPWRFVITDQKYSYYVDTRRVSRTGRGTVLVWTKVFWRYTSEGYAEKQRYIAGVLVPRVSEAEARKAEYIVYRQEYDCAGARYRILSSLVYSPAKSRIFSPSASAPDDYPSPWVAVTTEDAGGPLLNAVCGLRSRKPRR
jgi:hypothetical protein